MSVSAAQRALHGIYAALKDIDQGALESARLELGFAALCLEGEPEPISHRTVERIAGEMKMREIDPNRPHRTYIEAREGLEALTQQTDD